MADAGACDFGAAMLNSEPDAIRKTMTYDQDREMLGHKILPDRTDFPGYPTPHSPWQSEAN